MNNGFRISAPTGIGAPTTPTQSLDLSDWALTDQKLDANRRKLFIVTQN